MIDEMTGSEETTDDSWFPAGLMILVAVVVVAAAVGLGVQGGEPAAWLAGISAALVVGGGTGGHRGIVGCGVVGIAIASVVTTYERSVAYTLGVNAAVALVCMTALAGTALSFATRSNTVASGDTTMGFARSYAAATIAGIVTAVVALAIVLNVDWPSWLVLLPAILLALAAGALAAWSTRL